MQIPQTPIKQKRDLFHASLKQQHLSKNKMIEREQHLLCQLRKTHQTTFKNICNKLNTDCTNPSIITELIQYSLKEKLIIIEPLCLHVLPIMKKQLLLAQGIVADTKKILPPSALSLEKIQAASQALFEMVTLMIKASLDYPKICRYSNSQILDFILVTLELAKTQKIQHVMLQWAKQLSIRMHSNDYLINKGFLSIISKLKIEAIDQYLEYALYLSLRHESTQLNPKIVDDIVGIFETHKTLYEERELGTYGLSIMEQFVGGFVRKFLACWDKKVRKNKKITEVLYCLLSKIEKIPFSGKEDIVNYCKTLQHMAKGLFAQEGQVTEEQGQTILTNLDRIQNIRDQIESSYFQFMQQRQGMPEKQRKQTQEQKKQMETMVDSFATYLRLAITKLSHNSEVQELAHKYLSYVYQSWNSELLEAFVRPSQYRLLMKFSCELKPVDLPKIVNWFKIHIQDADCRNESCKVLARFNRQLDHKYDLNMKELFEFYVSEMKWLYQNRQIQWDEMTLFMLEHPYSPTDQEIQLKEKEIQFQRECRFNKEEKARKIEEQLIKEVQEELEEVSDNEKPEKLQIEQNDYEKDQFNKLYKDRIFDGFNHNNNEKLGQYEKMEF